MMANGTDISPMDRWKWAAHVPVDRAVDRALLMCLAESADRRTLETKRAMRTLQAQVRIGQRRLVEARQRLIDRGLVTVRTTVRNTATTYRLNVDLAAIPDDDRDVASNGDASSPPLLHPSWHSVAPPLDVDPGIIQEEGESLAVNEETARREANGTWAVGPYRFPPKPNRGNAAGRQR